MASRRMRFWLEAGTAAIAAAALLATALSPDWIELVFRVDPDGGNGAAEWLVVAVSALAAVTSSALLLEHLRERRAFG
jgi:hypothetical protein